MSFKVLIADDHPVVRRGVSMILASDPKFTVVAEATDGAEALDLGLTMEIDLAILDLAMPRLTGQEVAQQLARQAPRPRILILSMHHDPSYVRRAKEAGADGFLNKASVDVELLDACRTVMAGGGFVESAEAEHPAIEPPRDVEGGILTARETQIIALIASGESSRTIAERLTISPKTVERHRENLMAKLNLHNRSDLTRYAIRAGIVDP